MASALQSASAADLDLAEKLKQQLENFVTAGPLQAEFERQRSLYADVSDGAGQEEADADSLLDWFMYDWFDENGEKAIDHFLAAHPEIGEAERQILFDWEDSLNSVFQIRSPSRNALKLKELESGYNFTVTVAKPLGDSPFKKGQYISTRLLPLGDGFIFAGLHFILPNREAAMEVVEMRRALDTLNTPEALENAQREQCAAFVEFFGSDEVTVNPAELHDALSRFQRYLFSERPLAETGKTPAERFREEFGLELELPDMPETPPQLAEYRELTILCDEFDGLVLLPEFNRFKRVFSSSNPDRDVPGWQDLVWTYIKDPEIPIVAFERVAEQHPKRVEKALRALLNDPKFSIEHLYAALLHYKQPVEGLESLEDDARLWDLLNGSTAGGEKKARKPAKKAKKSSAKKSAAIKSPAQKSAAKKSAAKKAPAKETASKKGAVKKAAAKKAPAKKAAAKKAPAKKAVAPKAGAKKAAAKKTAGKKAPARKTARAKRAGSTKKR